MLREGLHKGIGRGVSLFASNWGYALFVAWNLASMFEADRLGHAVAGTPLLALISPLFIGIGGFAVFFLGRSGRTLRSRRPLMIGTGILGSVGLAMLEAALMTHATPTIAWLETAVSAMAQALVVSAWLERFMQQGLDSVIWNYLFGTVAGTLVYFAATLAGGPVCLAVLAVFPLAASLLCMQGAGTAGDGARAWPINAPSTASTSSQHGEKAGAATPVRAMTRLLVTVALVFCAGAAVKSQGSMLGQGSLLAGSLALTLAAQMLPCLCGKVLTAYAYALKTSVIFYVSVPAICFSAAMLMATDAGLGATVLASILGVLGQQMVGFLAVFKICEEYRGGRVRALPCIGMVNVAQGLGTCLGYALSMALESTASVVIATLLTLVCALLVVMGDVEVFSLTSVMSPADSDAAKRDKAHAVAARFGLTPREAQVLELWGIGHTSTFIQEQLGITKNTARTHITHIYEKTGTTSKEELLQLVESFEG